MKNIICFTLIIGFLLILALGCGGGGGGGGTVSTGGITGTVKKYGTDTPISGAQVACEGISTTTDGNGQFTLSSVPSGLKTITSTKSGYAIYTGTCNVSAGSVSNHNIVLGETVISQKTVELPTGSVINPEEINILTAAGGSTPNASGETDIQVYADEPQIMVAESPSGEPILLSLNFSEGTQKPLAVNSAGKINAATTAEALIQMNPLLLGLSGSERENVIQNIDTGGFEQLVQAIENLLKTDPDSVLADGSTVYQTANDLLVNALISGSSKRVSPQSAVDDVTLSVNENTITYTNPWLVYYASNVHDTNTNTDVESYIIDAASFHYIWGWPPFYLDESQTQKDISNGDYTINLTAGRGLVWDMESYRFKAFGANYVNLLLKLFSIPFPVLGLIPDPVACWLNIQSIVEPVVPDINDYLEDENYIGVLTELIDVMKKDITLLETIAESAGATSLASVCRSGAAISLLEHITVIFKRIANVLSMPEKVTFIVHWCTAPDFSYSDIHVGTVNHPPEIALTSPTGGETWSGSENITWTATDDDVGDTLTIDISYSTNSGGTWNVLVSDETNDGNYSWDTSGVGNGSDYRIKVVVDDSQATDTDTSSSDFTIDNVEPNNPPEVSSVSTSGSSGNITVTYDLTDTDGDTCSITVEYQGGSVDTTWTTAVTTGTKTNLTPGTGLTVTWNSGTDEPGQNHSDYKIRITPNDGKVNGVADESLAFNVDNTGGGGGGEVDLDLVYIEPGTFQMGQPDPDIGRTGWTDDEQPVHTVTITQGFWMGKYEVTNAQYAEFLNGKGVSSDGSYGGTEYIDMDDPDCQIEYSGGQFAAESGKDNYPVIEVSWYGAQAFCDWMAAETGQTYRLPTEAEWEYACRGGQQYQYGTDDGTIDSSKANYSSNVGHTTVVGSYPANPFGLYDMSGNVWEWCNDWYHGSYYSSSPENDPPGPSSGSYRVLRGGSWYRSASRCRSADRDYGYPDRRGHDNGLRVVSVSED